MNTNPMSEVITIPVLAALYTPAEDASAESIVFAAVSAGLAYLGRLAARWIEDWWRRRRDRASH